MDLIESCDVMSTVRAATEDIRPASGSKDVGNLIILGNVFDVSMMFQCLRTNDGRPSRGQSLTPAPD